MAKLPSIPYIAMQNVSTIIDPYPVPSIYGYGTAYAGAYDWSKKRIYIQTKYSNNIPSTYLHEYGHAVWHQGIGSIGRDEWLTTYPGDSSQGWYGNSGEMFAECFKHWVNPDFRIRTKIQNSPSLEQFQTFLKKYLKREELPFSDIEDVDEEGIDAIKYVNEAGLMKGYKDGLFRPWDFLSKRHVALVAERAGLIPSQDGRDSSFYNYSFATRGDVRDSFPELIWDSERWEENIYRSQFARLLYRKHMEEVVQSTNFFADDAQKGAIWG